MEGEDYQEFNVPFKPICQKGKRQSPIDIKTKTTRYQEFPPFKLEGHDKLALRLDTLSIENKKGFSKNEQPTIKLHAKKNLEPQKGGLLSGGPLRVPYQFQEMHFHWGNIRDPNASVILNTGTEHTLDGLGSLLELHMVHKNIHDGDIKEALEHEDGLAVLAFRFEGKRRNTSRPNESFENLAKIVRDYLTEPGSKFEKKDIPQNSSLDVNVMSFLPVLMDDYFFYKGSLTTGTCDEAVNWIVFKNSLVVETDQIIALNLIKDNEGKFVKNNFRKTQKVNDRPIYYHGRDLIEKKVITKGSNPRLNDIKTPKYTDFLLTLPNCLNYQTATMFDSKKDAEDRKLWNSIPCEKFNPSDENK